MNSHFVHFFGDEFEHCVGNNNPEYTIQELIMLPCATRSLLDHLRQSDAQLQTSGVQIFVLRKYQADITSAVKNPLQGFLKSSLG